MALKVLMVGGRRCGKTSALAVMFEQMINGVTNNFFTVADATVYATKNGEIQDTLTSKTTELRLFLERPTTKTFLVDSNPTENSWKYKCKLTLPGTINQPEKQSRPGKIRRKAQSKNRTSQRFFGGAEEKRTTKNRKC